MLAYLARRVGGAFLIRGVKWLAGGPQLVGARPAWDRSASNAACQPARQARPLGRSFCMDERLDRRTARTHACNCMHSTAPLARKVQRITHTSCSRHSPLALAGAANAKAKEGSAVRCFPRWPFGPLDLSPSFALLLSLFSAFVSIPLSPSSPSLSSRRQRRHGVSSLTGRVPLPTVLRAHHHHHHTLIAGLTLCGATTSDFATFDLRPEQHTHTYVLFAIQHTYTRPPEQFLVLVFCPSSHPPCWVRHCLLPSLAARLGIEAGQRPNSSLRRASFPFLFVSFSCRFFLVTSSCPVHTVMVPLQRSRSTPVNKDQSCMSFHPMSHIPCSIPSSHMAASRATTLEWR